MHAVTSECYLQGLYALVAPYGRELNFTDASVADDKAGVAVVYNSSSEHVCLPDDTTILIAELHAIDTALLHLLASHSVLPSHIVLFCDSSSALHSIDRSPPDYYVVCCIIQHWRLLHGRGCTVDLQWVPGHKQIPGNVQADHLANAARQLLTITPISRELDSFYPSIKVQIHKLWEKRWQTLTCPSFLRSLQASPSDWVPSCLHNRKHEVILARLRTGHASLNNDLFKLQKVSTCNCTTCGVPETVPHLLLSCHNFDVPRSHFASYMTALGLSFTVKNILGSDTRGDTELFQFLHLTNIFKRNCLR